ncbi:hypothetical protein Tco_0504608 [Tanacetum coccineum]
MEDLPLPIQEFPTLDMLLQECVSKDVMCSYLQSSSDLDEITELQCLYLHKVRECDCLAQKLSEQTDFVSKEIYTELLQSFAKLEKHSISIEIALQECQEQLKNDTVCKENASNVFRKEREQYFEIQDLKAQLQDKNIAISELKKLIETFKRKGVDTNIEQPSILGKPPVQSIRNQPVVRQPTAYKSERYQCPQQRFASQVDVSNKLTKPATPHSWHQMKESSLAKPNDLIAPGPSRNCPKHVSLQSPREKKDKDVNGKPSMIDPARLPNTANGCKPKPRNWQASMSSRVSNKDVHLGEHRKQKPFLKFNDLQCPTCKKCLYSANHDECVLEYLSRLNPRAFAQNAKSHKTTKRYMPVEKSSASKKPERQIPIGHRFSNKKTTTVPEKIMNPRSCLRWQLTGRIFKTVGLSARMVSQKMKSSAMTSVHNSSGLAPPRQMTSDHNSSELGIHDHSNELSSSKLVPKVVPPADKTATSRQENRVDTYAVRITMLIADIEDDIMDPVMQCTTLPSHSGFSQKKLVSFVTEIHTTSIDFLTPSRSYTLSWKPCQGNSLNLPDHRIHKDGDGNASFQLKSDSLPHAHAQNYKTFP